MISPAPLPTRRTPLHHWHVRHGARFGDRDGWHLPLAYSNAVGEGETSRSGLVLADVSANGKWSMLGGDGGLGVRERVGPDVPERPGSVATWGVGSESLLACRLTRDQLFLLADRPTSSPLPAGLADAEPPRGVLVADITSAWAGLLLAGPLVDQMLSRLTTLDIATALPPGSCAETTLAGVHAILTRTPNPALPTLLVHVGCDVAEYVAERLLEVGKGWGMTLLGVEGVRGWQTRCPSS